MSNYIPQVNDYVKWEKDKFSVEGWVYYKDAEYITIEIGVRCKNDEDIVHCPIHKKTHCCVLCHPEYWKELKYVRSRQSMYEEEEKCMAMVGKSTRREGIKV